MKEFSTLHFSLRLPFPLPPLPLIHDQHLLRTITTSPRLPPQTKRLESVREEPDLGGYKEESESEVRVWDYEKLEFLGGKFLGKSSSLVSRLSPLASRLSTSTTVRKAG